MGRELKRVAMVFDWPLKQIWRGYLNPHKVSKQCEACKGSGRSQYANMLNALWYGYTTFRPEDNGSVPFTPDHPAIAYLAKRNYPSSAILQKSEAMRLCEHFNSHWCYHLNEQDVAALVAGGRLYDLTHTWTPEDGWKPKVPAYVPTPAEVNEWSLSGFGHDSINNWVCIKARCKQAGVDSMCAKCNGEGDIWPSPEAKKTYEEWEREEPPAGDGYQLWETTSEGSPISPVFASLNELCEFAADNCTVFGSEKVTASHWREMLDAEFVCHREGNTIFL